MDNKLTRRKFLTVTGAAIPALNIFNIFKKRELPNIIWLIADDAGWNDFGCFGDPVIHTPNIDRLGYNGLRFTNAYITSPQCSPSRSSLWSSKYAHSTGTEDLHAPLPAKEKIFPQFIRGKNYFSGNVGKLHLGKPSRKKFDFISKDVDNWNKFFKKSPKNSPFFLALGFHQPHRPFKYKKQKYEYNRNKIILPPYLPDLNPVRKDLKRYYNEISKMDYKIGKLLKYLENNELLENTLIVFLSDNGPPFPRAKGFLYDPGIKTPLIFYWKNKIKAAINEKLVSTIDLVPTLLEMIDIDIPDFLHGESFYNIIKRKWANHRKYLFTERNWHDLDDHVRSVRTDKYKYIRNYLPWKPYTLPADVFGSPSFKAMLKAKRNNNLSDQKKLIFKWPRPAEELYDLEQDPNEFNNLAFRKDYNGIIGELKESLNSWEDRTNDVSIRKRKPDSYDYRKIFKKGEIDIQF